MIEETPNIETGGEKAGRKELRLEEIKELRRPIERILRGLMPHIETGEYGMIVGDDASGRIPALIFDKVLRGIYEAKGIDPPRQLTRFFAGSLQLLDAETRKGKTDEIAKILERHAAEKNNFIEQHPRVLVVTDTVKAGNSLLPITGALEQNRLPFDIAAIGVADMDYDAYDSEMSRRATPFEEQMQRREERLGGKIFYGMRETPKIFRNKASGVTKFAKDTFSHSKKIMMRGAFLGLKDYLEKELIADQADQEKRTREDADILAKDLIQYYQELEEEQGKEKVRRAAA